MLAKSAPGYTSALLIPKTGSGRSTPTNELEPNDRATIEVGFRAGG